MYHDNAAEYTPRPDLPTDYVAIGIVWKDGRVLVSLREKRAFLGGYWEFPGGKREPKESYKDCVIRELKEETGITVEAVRELYPVRYEFKSRRVVLMPYLCRHISGDAKPLKSNEVKWVFPDELRHLKMPDANLSIIEKIINGVYSL